MVELQSSSGIVADRTLVTALRARLASETGQPVALIETHISWVLLTEGHAYKLKKPVHLSFVDFSTLASRRHFCEEELRLNRRLAPALYLGVLAVCGTPLAPRLSAVADAEDAIDYAVQMRRFPDHSLLEDLLVERRLQPGQLEAFARRLALFHRDAEVASALSDFGAPPQVLLPVTRALAGLRSLRGADALQALETWVNEQADGLGMAWLMRQRGGAVRECHGDLHLGNVALVDGELLAFDCIEFDPALRWIDVMSEVAFLSMDLRAHGQADLAFRFLDAYLQHSGDYAGVPVLRFYEVYRALVRALVHGLRAQSGADPLATPAPDYLACARQFTTNVDVLPRLLITHGLSGSGKSTVATELLAAAGAIRVRSDVERKRLFGLGVLERSADQATDIYTQEATRRTFDRLAACARTALQAGYPVIVDAAFLRRAERRAFRALAAGLSVPFAILDCRAGEALLRHRVRARAADGGDASEADLAVLERQIATHEPLDDDERALALEVATEQPVDVAALCARWLAGRRG